MFCPVCNNNQLRSFLSIENVPAHCNVLWPDRQMAVETPKGHIELGFCISCGHVANMKFDPTLMAYDQAYENSLHFSPRFQSYATSLARDLVQRYDIYGKEIIELGSGQGDFLKLLINLGNNRGIGFDAAYVPDADDEANTRLSFVQDFDWQKHIDHSPDMIYTRHVLEHIEEPFGFVSDIREGLHDGRDTLVFMEMPNMAYTLRELAIWDIIYEHCGYYTPQSLTRLFERTGFDVLAVRDTFAGQFLTIEARPNGKNESSSPTPIAGLAELEKQVTGFSQDFKEKVAFWTSKIKEWEIRGKRAVAWGAGSKGVTFLNILQTQDQIRYIVDINPRKRGMYVAGSGQEIVSPDFLANYNPDVVILMNPIYKDEIAETLKNMGVMAEILIA